MRGHNRTRQPILACRGTFQCFAETKPPSSVRGRLARLWTSGALKPKTTVLLLDIKTKRGADVRDHAWFIYEHGFQELPLRVGDVIAFDAVWIEPIEGVERLKIVSIPKIIEHAPIFEKEVA